MPDFTNIVDYVSKKHYNGERKDEILNKLQSDPNAFNKALNDMWASHYTNVDEQKFTEAYMAKYGFKKKSQEQPASEPTTEDLSVGSQNDPTQESVAPKQFTQEQINDIINKNLPLEQRIGKALFGSIERVFKRYPQDVVGASALTDALSLNNTRDQLNTLMLSRAAKMDPEAAKELQSKYSGPMLQKYMNMSDEEFEASKTDLQDRVQKKEAAITEAMKYIMSKRKDAKEADYTDKFSQIDNPIEFLEYVASASGEGIAQIPASIITMGLSSLVQESGSIYSDQIEQIQRQKSEELGRDVTVDEIIEKGWDDPAMAGVYAVSAAALDRLGAGTATSGIIKKVLGKQIKEKALYQIGKGMVVEGATEGAQTGLEQVGSLRDIDWTEIGEGAAKGFFAAGPMSAASAAMSQDNGFEQLDKYAGQPLNATEDVTTQEQQNDEIQRPNEESPTPDSEQPTATDTTMGEDTPTREDRADVVGDVQDSSQSADEAGLQGEEENVTEKTSKKVAPKNLEIESVDDAIAEMFKGKGGYRISRDSWNSGGDTNIAKDEGALRLNYLSKSGMNIDEIASDLKDIYPQFEGMDEKDITERIVEFATKNPRGPRDYIDSRISTQSDINNYFEDGAKQVFGNNPIPDQTIGDIKQKLSSIQEDIINRVTEGYFSSDNILISSVKDEINQYLADPDNYEGGFLVNKDGSPKFSMGEINELNKIVNEELNQIAKGRSGPTNEAGIQSPTDQQKEGDGEGKGEVKPPFAPKKNYSQPIGFPKKKSTGRISIDPITNKETKKIHDIMLDLSKGIKSKIFTSKRKKKALGWYNPTNAAISIKFANDLDVTAHELGHSLDDRYGIYSDIPVEQLSAIENELAPLSEHGSKPPKGHPNAHAYRMGEGVAEWFRAYMVNPKEAQRVAPKFYETIKSKVPESMMKKIDEFGQDIRTFYGSPANKQIRANLKMSWDKQRGGFLDYLRHSTTDPDKFELTVWDKFARNWLNQLRPFEKGVDFVKKQLGIENLRPAKDPKMLARLALGVNSKVDNIIKHGLVDANNARIKDEKTGQYMSFDWLVEPFEGLTEAEIKNEIEETLAYMISERTLELGERFGKDILTGIGGGVIKDIDVAKRNLELFQSYPKAKQDKIIEATRRYREFADNILRYMVDKGRMKEEIYQKIKADNIHYVALQRVLNAAPDEEVVVFESAGKALGRSSEVIKKIKGSSRTIKDPYQSIVNTLYKAVNEADRNDVLVAFKDLIETNRDMYKGDVANISQVAQKASPGDVNTIPIFDRGKKLHYQFDDDIYQSLKNIVSGVGSLPGGLTAYAKVVRWTVTNFPIFALRNRIRDFQSRFVISKNRPEKGLDIMFKRGLRKDIKDQFELFGGGQAGYYVLNDKFYKTQMLESIDKIRSDKSAILTDPKRMGKEFGDWYSRIMSSSETASRLEEYRSAFKKAKKQGMDDYNASIYAAYESRDLLDFAIAGEQARIVNQVVPFFNAAIQGTRKMIRTAQERPGQFAARWMLYAVAPALLNRMLIGMTDREDEYKKLPAWRKDLFYNIPIGPNLWLTIPKPFELGVLASGAERFIDRVVYKNEDAFDGYIGSVARSTIPIDEAAFAGPVKPAIEVATNYDFFRQKRIIPTWDERKNVKLRNTDKASRLGQALQKASGIDARMADHLIGSTFTYFGNLGMTVSDIGRDDSRYQFDLTDLGVFRNSSVYDSQDVQWVMDKAVAFNLTRNKYYAEMQMLVKDYFNAKTDEEKEKRGKVVRDYANKLRKAWEAVGLEDAHENTSKFKREVRKNLDTSNLKNDVKSAKKRQRELNK